MKRFWLTLRARLSRATVVILIRGQEATCLRGRVPATLLQELTEVARISALEGGLITASGTGGVLGLRFSASIPQSVRQRIRNAWFAHGA